MVPKVFKPSKFYCTFMGCPPFFFFQFYFFFPLIWHHLNGKTLLCYEQILSLRVNTIVERFYCSRPQGYNILFMFNSAEHEILNDHKYKNIKKLSIFQAQISLECYFFLLISIKMPTIVGISTFMSRKKFKLSWVEHETRFITSGPGCKKPQFSPF